LLTTKTKIALKKELEKEAEATKASAQGLPALQAQTEQSNVVCFFQLVQLDKLLTTTFSER
jgi:hypothetical protein